MKKAGRALVAVLIAVVVVGAAVAMFLLAGSSPTSVANDFMIALARGNTKDLTRLSYMGDMKPEEVEKAWQQSVKRGELYRFVWRNTGYSQPSDTSATVDMQIVRNADNPGSYEEKFGIPMVREDGQWKVDVRNLNRGIYPGLPR